MNNLAPFFSPRSVAVVGAGERPTSSGGAVLRMLHAARYPGEVIPINPKGGEIFGLAVKTSLRELSQPAELAVIVVRPELILEVVQDAAASGHKHLMILPGGFAEAGPEGVAREQALRRLTAATGITLVGPNCAGIIRLTPEAPFAATFFRDLPPGGGIAAISQSGAIIEEVIAAANQRKLPVGTVVSVGNAVQLGVVDYLEYLGQQPDCQCVLLYIESIADHARFIRSARQVALHKPIVALIGGRSAFGAVAAKNHTGAQALSDGEAQALCHEAGIIRVTSLRRLLLAAKGFGFFPHGLGRRIMLFSNSGGPGVITADRISDEGLELPVLPPALAEQLRAQLPPEAAVANPVDLLADAREERFVPGLRAVQEHAAGVFDAILIIHIVPFMVEAAPVITALAAQARESSLPILHSMMGTLPDKDNWFTAMERAGVPMFNDAEEMAETAGLLAQYPPLRVRLRQ